jgi:hypothetical protein
LLVLDTHIFLSWRVLSVSLLISVAAFNLACSKKPLPGDTSFIRAKKGFEKELTPDQRKAAIKQLQTETAGKP